MPRPEGQELDLRVWRRLCGTTLGLRLFLRCAGSSSNQTSYPPSHIVKQTDIPDHPQSHALKTQCWPLVGLLFLPNPSPNYEQEKVDTAAILSNLTRAAQTLPCSATVVGPFSGRGRVMCRLKSILGF
ncbi:uncharacterized protein M437DRAFT_69604 [Aureobasidium melanogenum CBS 110374]|uniref:Uncharacterized protein n=1 Tax=Aureobasidium melanogenum (strain CBS 110374) TaxID=1043003 RepID=A0A074W8R2_AURM1|nr:uncharacterized protein M437DRAFT_69604 [Aureobasidium melanogenum CBS 110374]KEQ58941.1 hypothetical protein M437DRAFT_69604 [Aureobasidium melanogenum CBS 110374]